MSSLPFNLRRDLTFVAAVSKGALALEVNPSFQVKSVAEFIAYAKANPAKTTVASYGIGSTSHLAQELFKMMTGINVVHVPYRGDAPALTDAISGQVQSTFSTLPASLEYVRTGKLRALGVTTATRWDALPEVPTFGDFVPGYEASTWSGVAAPKGIPLEIVEKLNREINAGLADPKIRARIADLGRRADANDANRIRQADCRRHREVGQGDPGGQHQGGVIRPGSGNPLHSMAATKKVQHVADL